MRPTRGGCSSVTWNTGEVRPASAMWYEKDAGTVEKVAANRFAPSRVMRSSRVASPIFATSDGTRSPIPDDAWKRMSSGVFGLMRTLPGATWNASALADDNTHAAWAVLRVGPVSVVPVTSRIAAAAAACQAL